MPNILVSAGRVRSTISLYVWLALLPSTLAAASPSAVSGPSTQAIDHYLSAEMSRQHIPGLALAIVRDGKPFYFHNYGAASLEHPVSVTADTLFQIGSVGKQFTAVAVMMLANDRKLDLDDSVRQYLPELPPAWQKVTLRLMLNHQSGIAQFTTPQRQLLDLSHDYADEELIRLAASQPLDFEPGTDVSYSDTGYVLLGFVINRVSGMFYGDYLQRNIFQPLGMHHTRIISDADIILGRASGYERREDGTLRNQIPVSAALNRTADGSLYSTTHDLVAWDNALNAGALLPAFLWDRMWRVDPHDNGQAPLFHYTYGWENNDIRGHQVLEYDGTWQGFQAVMSRYIDAHLTVVILTNLALCRTERLAHTVAGLVDTRLTPYVDAAHDSRPHYTQAFQLFLADVAAARPPSALSDAGRQQLVPRPLHTLRRNLVEIGPITRFSLSVDDASADALPDLGKPPAMRRVYRVESKDNVEFFRVQYAGDGQIDDLHLLSEF